MKRKVFQKRAIDGHERKSQSIEVKNEDDAHNNRHWRRSKTHGWIETFFSIFTGSYFLIVLLFSSVQSDTIELVEYVICASILTVLPFYRVRRVFDTPATNPKYFDVFTIQSQPFRAAVSAIFLIVPVFLLQSYDEIKNVVAVYFALTILFRVADSRSLYDSIAICSAYTVALEGGLISIDERVWFATVRLVLWVSLFLGIFCAALLRQSTFRIWEHIRLLIILRKRSEEERVFSNFIAAAHFSPDFLTRKDINKSVSNVGWLSKNEKKKVGTFSVQAPYSSPLSEAASVAGILFSFDKKPVISLEKIKSLDGLERKLATVIAFKQVIPDGRECCLNNQNGNIIHNLLDIICVNHKISCVRKFGDTWVGCIGFHKTHDNNRKDCYHAILMGCEAVILAKKMQIQLCCAVESGKIDAGFISGSNYDVFGPEIRYSTHRYSTNEYST